MPRSWRTCGNTQWLRIRQSCGNFLTRPPLEFSLHTDDRSPWVKLTQGHFQAVKKQLHGYPQLRLRFTKPGEESRSERVVSNTKLSIPTENLPNFQPPHSLGRARRSRDGLMESRLLIVVNNPPPCTTTATGLALHYHVTAGGTGLYAESA